MSEELDGLERIQAGVTPEEGIAAFVARCRSTWVRLPDDTRSPRSRRKLCGESAQKWMRFSIGYDTRR
jgi:hypothetical protein